jgi:tetratricopeptide (TPR) repeat protein
METKDLKEKEKERKIEAEAFAKEELANEMPNQFESQTVRLARIAADWEDALLREENDIEKGIEVILGEVGPAKFIELLNAAEKPTPPSFYEQFASLGDKLLEEEKFEEARAVFSLITSFSPEFPLGWLGYCESLGALGKLDEAYQAAIAAISTFPWNPDLYALAVDLGVMADHSDSVKEFITASRQLIENFVPEEEEEKERCNVLLEKLKELELQLMK